MTQTKALFLVLVISLASLACTPKAQKSLAETKLKREWMLKKLQGIDDALVVKSGASINLTNLSKTGGKAGCNRAMFQTSTDMKSKISFSNIATTKMFCEPFMKVEDAYTKLLPQISSFKIEGQFIQFFNNANKIVAEGVASDWD